MPRERWRRRLLAEYKREEGLSLASLVAVPCLASESLRGAVQQQYIINVVQNGTIVAFKLDYKSNLPETAVQDVEKRATTGR